MHVMSLKWTFNVVESSRSSLLSLEIFNFSNRSQFIELKVSAKAEHSGLNEECLTCNYPDVVVFNLSSG